MNDTDRDTYTFDSGSYAYHEAIADIAIVMGLVDFRPDDSRDRSMKAVAWAEEFERWYQAGIRDGSVEEDSYIEAIDDFAIRKLAEVSHLCERWGDLKIALFAPWPDRGETA